MQESQKRDLRKMATSHNSIDCTAKPLTHCPVCRYDLTGLPKTHACPECGFEYDESMRTWTNRHGIWWFALHISCLLFIAFFLIVAIWNRRIYSLICDVAMLAMLISVIRKSRSRRCLVMSGRGLYIQQIKSKKIVFYPWSDIRLHSGTIVDISTPRTLWGLMNTDLTPYTSIYHVSAEGKINKRIPLPIEHASRKQRKMVYEEIYKKWHQATHP